ncbi:fimbria/pilus outer membrane usher protein [Corallococcus silvisoli]|uniref:fimbria/pilus outer membrane usher protein n=1 Tax=Corallococcus silvisoli TaxID=2697031 RepID=UPI0013785557|nr:fimbria/pilus outer membrane usher protein [Corallococcus silvisoli]NBD07936.1 fimbria/pilus outer membrane usher protein [Corallococcus silvisoli]
MSPFPPSGMRGTWHLTLAMSLLLLGATPAPAQEPAVGVARTPQQLSPIVVEFTLNGVARGDVFPVLRDGDVLVPVSALESFGVDVARLGARREVLGAETYVSLQSLPPPATFQLDERGASLRCDFPPSAFNQTRIDLGVFAPPGYKVSGSPSAFFNYAARARNTFLTFYGEAGASLGRGVLTTQARWNPGEAPLRGLTQLTVDFPEAMVRTVAGEATGYGGVLGGGAVVAGLHVMRSFELNPYFVRNPMQDIAGDVTTPSTLEVYVNNQLVRRTELPPGPYRLENLTVPRGEGTTRYLVRDAFGRVSEVNTSYSLSGQSLSPGVADYRLSAGVERESLSTRSFDFGRGLLLGTFRMGATPWLTPGVRLELATNMLSTGAVQLFQLPLGELELSQAISRGEGRTGAAAGLVYALQGQRVGGSVFSRTMSAHYLNTSLQRDDDHPMVETGGGLFLALGSRASVSGQAAVTRWRERGWTVWAGATTAAQVTDRVSVSLSASRSQEARGLASLEGMLFLNAVLDARTTGSVGHVRGTGGGDTALDISRGVPLEGGLGFQAQAQLGRFDYARGRVDYEGDVGHYAAGLELQQGKAVGLAEVSGGLVAIGGGIHATRAVDQGFALVRVDGAENIGVLLNNHLIGRTDSQGEYVVTRLQSYSPNRLSVSDEELPLEDYLPTTERMVAPWLRGGVVLDFQKESVRAFRGRVVLASGTGALAYGELRVDADGKQWLSPVGAGGEFELVGVPPGRYAATVRHPMGRCSVALEIPSKAGSVIDLGTVRCVNE